MRFKRTARYEFQDTSRKRALVPVMQRKAREKLPLLGPLIAETQPDVDTVMQQRAEGWARSQRETRARKAADWWRARARLAGLPEEERKALLAYWNNHRWLPGDPTYLLSTIHSFQVGDLLLIDEQIVSAHEIEWKAKRDAKIRAMTDAELDHGIQTHISMQFVELMRAERRRRQEGA